MDAKYCSDNIFKAAPPIAQHLVRYLGIGILTVIVSLGFADKVYATYCHSDYARNGAYIDSQRYYLLDYGQYYYLDSEQYNLIGELGYFLGHPFYPKLHEKELGRTVGFTNVQNKGWFMFFLDEQFPVNEHALKNNYYFNTQDSIDRQHYYFLDKGQYNYLEKRQYNLLGGLAYSYRYPYYGRQLAEGIETIGLVSNPEPSTIGFLGLGAVWLTALRKKRRTLAAA